MSVTVHDGDLMTSEQLAARLGIDRTTLSRWRALGRVPRPVLPHRRQLRWSRGEIEEWLAAKCPAEAEWESRRQGRK